MRAFPMCFAILQAPRYGVHALNSLWQGSFSFQRSSRIHGSNRPRFNVISSKPNELEGGYSRRWIRTKTTETRKPVATTRHEEVLDEVSAVSTSSATTLNVVNKVELNELLAFESSCDIRQQLAESKDLHKLVTVIVFDLETTGLGRQSERIIEIAFRDLGGGENSTFETLVNPERLIHNSYVHGINDYMVTRPGVPRMKELIPIIVQYIESRRKKGGYVLLVAHNARTFDVPFLKSEFERCSFHIPPDWLFYCTLPLARQVLKSEQGSKVSPRVSLEALKSRYGIEVEGRAHRAMADVNALSLIVQRLTFDLKKPLSYLVKDSFTASELKTSSKKKSKTSK